MISGSLAERGKGYGVEAAEHNSIINIQNRYKTRHPVRDYRDETLLFRKVCLHKARNLLSLGGLLDTLAELNPIE